MLKDSERAMFCDDVAPQETKLERERRRALGIYYTPPEAAKILARWVIRSPNETVLEPSFGGCAMLSAAVSALRSLGNDRPSRQLYGYDIDGIAFEHLAQIGIDNTEGHFKRQDFLRSNAGELRVDAVLANPPFVSYHRQNEAQADQVDRGAAVEDALESGKGRERHDKVSFYFWSLRGSGGLGRPLGEQGMSDLDGA